MNIIKKFLFIIVLFSGAHLCQTQVPVEITNDVPSIQTPPNILNRDLLRVGIYGGYSRMTGATPTSMGPIYADHVNRLKNGYHIGADFDVFVSRIVALGVKYSLFRTKDEINNLIFEVDGDMIPGKLSQNMFVHYIAPNIILKAGRSAGKVFFIFDGSMGCLIYKNNATMIQTDFVMRGVTFGVSVAPGIEFKVTPSFAISFNLGLTVGTVNTIKATGGITETLTNAGENISRLDVSIGLRWYQLKQKKM